MSIYEMAQELNIGTTMQITQRFINHFSYAYMQSDLGLNMVIHEIRIRHTPSTCDMSVHFKGDGFGLWVSLRDLHLLDVVKVEPINYCI